ncbi:MAG TPA: hypothetical protein VH350_11955 [Candidatus Sulfotelmatobacter sp.]|nr:hypothetical protein [Candidatus Sulfotelmatobacter sp.]
MLQAIGIVLAQAEEQERQHPGGTAGVSSGENSISFHSAYDFQLFAVATAIQHQDPDSAGSLLSRHLEVAADLKRYPEGLASLDVLGFRPEQNVLRVDHRKPQGLQLYNAIEEAQNLSSLDMGLEFTIPRDLNTLGVTGSVVFSANPGTPEALVLSETGTCPADVSHRLELARTVPVMRKEPFSCGGPAEHQWCSYLETFPRASLIQAIAERCTYYDDPTGARRALREQLELANQIPEEHRIDFLATAADLYLRLGDRQSAADVVQSGFVAASGVYNRNLSSAFLEKFPKGIWPSAKAYRRMITLGVNADLEMTRKAIDQIPDTGLAELERTMLARSLLGVPVRQYMEMKPSGSFCTGETAATYDQF